MRTPVDTDDHAIAPSITRWEIDLSKPFFSRFKSMVSEFRDQDPGGRYFAILLEQVYNEAPDVMRAALFPGAPKAAFAGSLARTEWEYAPGRKADLAIFDPGDALLALVEIKEKDQNGPGAPGQLRAYLAFCGREGVRFSYVTRRSPSVECLDVLQGSLAKVVYYSDLYGAIVGQGSALPLVQLFCDYLKEERMAYRPLAQDDLQSLKILLLQGNNMSGRGHGRMKVAARTGAAASMLDRLVGNAEVLGSAFHMRHRECFGQRFVPVFSFWPEIDFAKLAKRNAKDAAYTYIDKDLVLNGHLLVYSEGRLKTSGDDKGCYVWVGFAFDIDKPGNLKTSYVAGVGTLANSFERTRSVASMPTKSPHPGRSRSSYRGRSRWRWRTTTTSGTPAWSVCGRIWASDPSGRDCR